MKNYELTYLLSSELSEEELKSFSQKIIEIIQKENGEIIEDLKTEKKRLGCPIKKQREAYLGVLSFNLDNDKIENFSQKLKSEPQILRFLITVKKLPRFVKERRHKIIAKIEKPKLEKPIEEKKVEIEDIEKKLAEILGEI